MNEQNEDEEVLDNINIFGSEKCGGDKRIKIIFHKCFVKQVIIFHKILTVDRANFKNHDICLPFLMALKECYKGTCT